MKIKDIYQNKKAVFSFEIFPPNENFSSEKLYGVIDELSIQKPDFISVTYGAGGSTSTNTLAIAKGIQEKYGVATIAHLTCVGASKDSIIKSLSDMRDAGIENVLALRGDKP